MHKAFIFCFILESVLLTAQPTIGWKISLGGTASDKALSTAMTPDGGTITAGYTNSTNGDVLGNHGNFDCWVIKTDSQGVIQWKHAYGGSNGEWPYAIAVCNDGGYIMTGFTLSNDQNVSGNHGDVDVWVVKLNSGGGIQWQKCLGGSGHEEAWSIQQTEDEGFILAGRATSTDGDVTQNKGGYDYWVVKLTKNGALEWQKTLGGSNEDTATFILQTPEGDYLVIGESQSKNGDVQSGSHGDGDYWVVKLNSTGDIIWERALGGSNWDRTSEAVYTPDGGYLIAGYASSGNGDQSIHYGGLDAWLVKLGPAGDLEWEKTYGGSFDDWALSLQVLNNGHYLVSGTTLSNDIDILVNKGYNDLWVFEIDPNGQLVWSQTFGGTKNEYAYSCRVDAADNAFLVGSSSSSDGDVGGNQGQTDYWMIKLSPESTSTREHDSKTLEIFPNPTTNTLQVHLPEGACPKAVSIINVYGKVALHVAECPPNGILQLEQLAAGMYWVQAMDDAGNNFSGKIIKQ